MNKEHNFFSLVIEVTKQVPCGRVTSYGAIARYLGTSQSSRMVGYALNGCHKSGEFIPAHRVVNRNGLLSGKHRFDGPDVMQQLLESEGIEVEHDRVVRFKELFWDPTIALKMIY